MIRRDRILRLCGAIVPPVLAALVALAGPGGGALQAAAAQASSANVAADPAARVAALLAAAETAPDAAARAPIVAQLDALGVRLADGAGDDDPLSRWRQADKNGSESPWRGRALGPAYRRARVGAGESLVIEQIFLAGQRARIAAQTTGGSGVALAISNPRSEPVCTRQLAPAASCQFLPIYTERFAITLHNRGRQAVSIYMVFQ